MKHRHFSALAVPFLFLVLSGGCNGGVKHPPAGEPNDEETCANRPSGEMNCLACSSVPGCAWCGNPSPSKSQCQPGVSAEMPATCRGAWAQSTEDCEEPPPVLPEDM